jgi:hypothetical protein
MQIDSGGLGRVRRGEPLVPAVVVTANSSETLILGDFEDDHPERKLPSLF